MKIQIEIELDDETLKSGGVSEEYVREHLPGLLWMCFSGYVGDHSRPGFELREESVICSADRTEWKVV